MKSIKIQIIAFILIMITGVSCSNSTKKENPVTETAVEKTSEPAEVKTDGIAPILSGYLAMNSALVESDSEGAAEAGKQILSGLEKVELNTIPEDKMERYKELAANIKEDSEFIIEDVGHLDYQREHLEDLSNDMLELIELVGTTQKLYKIHCPMVSNDKGADWLSDTKEVKNPYYGDAMLTCGAVVKEFQP